MKRLILDRGFLDGPSIGHCKKDLGIEVLIPARKDEAARKRTLAAAQNRKVRGPVAAPPLRSEVAAVADLETFTTCPIPIHAVVNR
jgi:hypothetical protein